MCVVIHGARAREKKRTNVPICALRLAVLVSLPMLFACAQSQPMPSAQSGQSSAHGSAELSAIEKPVRVIVKFRRTVPYEDPVFLQGIAQQIQARISYVASVSPDTHVYLLEPLAGQRSADALTRLANLPTVLWVELDQVVTHF